MLIINSACIFFQKEKPNFKYELIVVDDGSSDRTTEVSKC